MSYDYREYKTVIVLADQLAPGQALNVVGHLAITLGASGHPALMGRPTLLDASGVIHRGISRYAVIVTAGRPAHLKKLVESARSDSRIVLADYPEEMLTTGHDDELAAALQTRPSEELTYLGALLFGPSEAIQPLTKRFSLWR